jgi:hypothetical protein
LIIRSVLDLVDPPLGTDARAMFASLCAQRAVGVWTPADSGPVADLFRRGLELAFGPPDGSGLESLRSAQRSILDQLNEDSNFGDFHSEKLQAVVSVAHALAACAALDDADLAHESRQAAQAEIALVKGMYFERIGSYDGVNDHVSLIRQLRWQRGDLAALAEGIELDTLRARATAQGQLLNLGVRTDDWSHPGPA